MDISSNRGYIKVSISGLEDEDCVQELFYHDPSAQDDGVVYCKDIHEISLSFNPWARETHELLPGAQIRYRWDRDHNFANFWDTSANATAVTPIYSEPFSFLDLEYEDGSPLVGTTGPKPGIERNNSTRATYYYRGVLDEFGDEFHTMHTGCNIRNARPDITQIEYTVTCGRSFHFCVNPKTPAIKVMAHDGAEFYTTPLKNYNEPKIYSQTTYIWPNDGSISILLRDINDGGNIFYRIVNDPEDNSTPYIETQESSVILNDYDFNFGEQYLQFYYNESYIKYRKIVKYAKNEGFPSADEIHGNLFFGEKESEDQEYSDLEASWRASINDPLDYRSNWFSKDIKSGFPLTLPAISSGDPAYRPKPLDAAMVTRIYGNDYKRTGQSWTFAQWSRYYLTHGSIARLDPVGWEMNHSGVPQPNKILNNRGYETSGKEERLMDLPFAYDILIAQFRSDQDPRGITPAEDFLIRDRMGKWVFLCMQEIGGGKNNAPGMWGRNRFISAQIMTLAMPKYDSDYYGTSGFDGTLATRYNLPFPDYTLSWKNVFIDENYPTPGYPNPTYLPEYDKMWTSSDDAVGQDGITVVGKGAWRDKPGYFTTSTCAGPYGVLAMMAALHTGKEYPNFFIGINRGKTGTLQFVSFPNGETTLAQPAYGYVHLMCNSKYPDNNEEFIAAMIDKGDKFIYAPWNDLKTYAIYTQYRFSDSAAYPTPFPAPGQFELPINIILPDIPNTEWYYTLDGSPPSISSNKYMGPLFLSENTTIKIIGVEEGKPNSEIFTGEYIFVDVAPPRNLKAYSE